MQMPSRPAPHDPRTAIAGTIRPATNVIAKASNSRVLVILVSILAALLIASHVAKFVGKQMLGASVNTKRYQALFLTNGQVYFGKVSKIDDSYVKITDIYYLQVQQQVQPQSAKPDGQQPQVSLAKLGSELHGPEDVMFVNREQVLFWENLKDDGKVAQAIKDHKAKK